MPVLHGHSLLFLCMCIVPFCLLFVYACLSSWTLSAFSWCVPIFIFPFCLCVKGLNLVPNFIAKHRLHQDKARSIQRRGPSHVQKRIKLTISASLALRNQTISSIAASSQRQFCAYQQELTAIRANFGCLVLCILDSAESLFRYRQKTY